jgi:hypothetical protein
MTDSLIDLLRALSRHEHNDLTIGDGAPAHAETCVAAIRKG